MMRDLTGPVLQPSILASTGIICAFTLVMIALIVTVAGI